MSFDFDFGEELESIRGGKERTPSVKKEEPTHVVGGGDAKASVKEAPKEEPLAAPVQETPVAVAEREVPQNEEIEVRKHTHGGEDAKTADVVSDDPYAIDWRAFKTLPGMFEHVGGDRPVVLNDSVKHITVSGVPEPFVGFIQKQLEAKYKGAVIDFPWGSYTITEKNRVFTTRASLMRYLMLDALRNADGIHVQYAYQSMVLKHPVFTEAFDPDVHLGQAHDELDIYALLYVAHSSEATGRTSGGNLFSEEEHRTSEHLDMLSLSMGRILDKLDDQARLHEEHMERSTMVQTVLLLDRMGLLQGGLPRDVGEFIRLLEVNRELLKDADKSVAGHIHGEKDREKVLLRENRMRAYQVRNGAPR